MRMFSLALVAVAVLSAAAIPVALREAGLTEHTSRAAEPRQITPTIAGIQIRSVLLKVEHKRPALATRIKTDDSEIVRRGIKLFGEYMTPGVLNGKVDESMRENTLAAGTSSLQSTPEASERVGVSLSAERTLPSTGDTAHNAGIPLRTVSLPAHFPGPALRGHHGGPALMPADAIAATAVEHLHRTPVTIEPPGQSIRENGAATNILTTIYDADSRDALKAEHNALVKVYNNMIDAFKLARRGPSRSASDTVALARALSESKQRLSDMRAVLENTRKTPAKQTKPSVLNDDASGSASKQKRMRSIIDSSLGTKQPDSVKRTRTNADTSSDNDAKKAGEPSAASSH